MKHIVIAAGYATRLYPLTENFPKPLLQIGRSSILDRLIADVDTIADVTEHIIVSNHKFAPHFHQWLDSHPASKPISILDDGTTSNASRLGAVRDLLLALDRYDVDDDILVAAADNILDFSLASFVGFFRAKQTSVVLCYHEPSLARLQRMGVLTVDADMRVTDMTEKPAQPATHWAVPPFYIYHRSDLPLIRSCLDHGCGADAPGNLAAYLCHATTLYACPMPGHRYDIGSLASYEEAKKLFGDK